MLVPVSFWAEASTSKNITAGAQMATIRDLLNVGTIVTFTAPHRLIHIQ